MEYLLLTSAGREQITDPGLILQEDGSIVHQDSSGNRVTIAPYVDVTPLDASDRPPYTLNGAKAPIFNVGSPLVDMMNAGNFSFSIDLANSEVVVTAIDADGVTVLVGSIPLSPAAS